MFRFFVLGTLALASGCASSGTVTAGADFEMTAGQQVALPDASTLRYVGIANDSRCPPDVRCIRAGDADVQFDHAAGGGANARVTLNTERTRSTALGHWQLQLVDLARRGDPPVVTLRIDADNAGATP